jgi:hypothetical protein
MGVMRCNEWEYTGELWATTAAGRLETLIGRRLMHRGD